MACKPKAHDGFDTHDRARRHDGRRQELARPQAGGAAGRAVPRCRQRDRGRGRLLDHRNLRPLWRDRLPRRRAQGRSRACWTSRRMCWRPAAAPSSTRDPRPDQDQRGLGLDQGADRTAAGARAAGATTARCCATAIRARCWRRCWRRASPIYAEADIAGRKRGRARTAPQVGAHRRRARRDAASWRRHERRRSPSPRRAQLRHPCRARPDRRGRRACWRRWRAGPCRSSPTTMSPHFILARCSVALRGAGIDARPSC